MVARDTSIDAYNKIKSSGLLSRLRFAVYDKLFTYGPMTQGEMWKRFFDTKQRHDICPRFAELEARGVIRSIGERPCGVTGRMAMLWDVTSKLPKEPCQTLTKTEMKIRAAVEKERIACAKIAEKWDCELAAHEILERVI